MRALLVTCCCPPGLLMQNFLLAVPAVTSEPPNGVTSRIRSLPPSLVTPTKYSDALNCTFQQVILSNLLSLVVVTMMSMRKYVRFVSIVVYFIYACVEHRPGQKILQYQLINKMFLLKTTEKFACKKRII